MKQSGPGEPPAGPWRAVSLDEFLADLCVRPEVSPSRPLIVAIDGRSGSGKSTLAHRVVEAVPGSVLVGTDDVAWHVSMFGWADVLAEHILKPVRQGHVVTYRPPEWDTHSRPGSIDVPQGIELLVVEGVGAGRQELTSLIDVLIWVQSDLDEAERRGIERDIAAGVNGDVEASNAFWHRWMAAEVPFLERDRPWARASVIVAGTPVLPHKDDEIVIAGEIRHG